MGLKISKIQGKKQTQRTENPVRPSQRLLSLAQAAEYLGRGVDSLREMLYARELMCIQKGRGKIWLDIKDLDNWIEGKKAYM